MDNLNGQSLILFRDSRNICMVILWDLDIQLGRTSRLERMQSTTESSSSTILIETGQKEILHAFHRVQ